MRTPNRFRGLRTRAMALASVAVPCLTFASAAAAKTQLNPFAQLGGEVDLTTVGEYCLAGSGDTCLASATAAAPGASPGRFENPQSAAVDQSTGDVYVAEQLNQRVQKLAPDGEFLLMFGTGVLTSGASGQGTLKEGSTSVTSVLTSTRAFVAGQTITGSGIQPATRIVSVSSGKITLSKPAAVSGEVANVALTVKAAAAGVPVNEQQTVTIAGAPTGGSFTLSYKTPTPSSGEATTAAIPYNASAGEVKTALEALSNMSVAGGEVAVAGAAGGPYTVEFKGARYEDTNVEQLKATSSLTGGASPAVAVATIAQGDGAPADDVCTKAQAADCEVGFTGGALPASELPGQFSAPFGVAVDNSCHEAKLTEATVPTCAAAYPANANVFVEDRTNHRVQEFSANGEFVAMIGGSVNKTATEKGGGEAERNLCTEAEIKSVAKVECQLGTEAPSGTTPQGQFRAWPSQGNLLFLGLNSKSGSPAEDVLYVGDEGRVQEFEASSGHFKRELPLVKEKKVQALTADHSGDLYVSQEGVEGVHVYEPGSNGSSQLTPFEAGSVLLTTTSVKAIAFDPVGDIAVVEKNTSGELYSATGKHLGSYGAGFVESGVAFDDASEDLYAPKATLKKVTAFSPVITPEVLTGAAATVGTATATLAGEVEPEGIAASSRFEYGVCPSRYPSVATCPGSAYGSSVATTPAGEQAGEAKVPVQAGLTGLLPNQTYHYRLAAENRFGPSLGEEATFATNPVPPVIGAAPKAAFTTSTTAVLSGSFNPENALAIYSFEYVSQRKFEESGWTEAAVTEEILTPSYADAELSTSEELVGLTPDTTYHARLVSENEHKEVAEGPETTFATAPTPAPTVATGGYGGLTSTGAVISGTVNPDGVPATYAFELGVYAGAGTQYGVVSSGSAGTGTQASERTLALSGLQPGTTYAYRMSISSGYLPGSHTLQGAVVTFTTPGLPAAIAPPPLLAQLPIPKIPFPKSASPSKKGKAKKISKHKSKKKGRKGRKKGKRARRAKR